MKYLTTLRIGAPVFLALLAVSAGGSARESAAACAQWNIDYTRLVTDFNNDFAELEQDLQQGKKEDSATDAQITGIDAQLICDKERARPENCAQVTQRPANITIC